MSNESMMESFKNNILKDKILPCVNVDIDDMIINRRRWERTEFFLEYFYELLLVLSFAGVFLNSKIILGVLIGSIGCCNRLITNAQKNQNKITERLNIYLKNFGIKPTIPDDNNMSEIIRHYTENPLNTNV